MWRIQHSQCLRYGRSRRAFTIIELLVVFAIVGILVSLILPAVLRATESARRLECASRLSQLAKAAATFEASHRSLPTSNYHKWKPALPAMQSPWLPLLPFVDQDQAFRQINMQETGGGAYPAPPSSSLNGNLLKLRVAAFVCPSDGVWPGGCNYRACLGISAGSLQRAKWRGASYALGVLGAKAPLSATTDGLSQTVLYSEKLNGDGDDGVFTPSRDAYLVPLTTAGNDPDSYIAHCQSNWSPTALHFSFGGSTWFFSTQAYTWYNHVTTPNAKMPDCASDLGGLTTSATTARSWHAGGVNAVFVDGASRFVNTAIDLQVWRALGTRAGHEPNASW